MDWIFEIIIICIFLATGVIYKDEIMAFVSRILECFSSQEKGAWKDILTLSDKTFIVSLSIAAIVLFIFFVLLAIVNYIKDNKASKRQDEERAKLKREEEERRLLFFKDFPLNEDDLGKLFKEVQEIIVLDESVKENYYIHANSKKKRAEWGVYVGKFFLRCSCTVSLYRCVKILRENGVAINSDPSCVSETENGEKVESFFIRKLSYPVARYDLGEAFHVLAFPILSIDDDGEDRGLYEFYLSTCGGDKEHMFNVDSNKCPIEEWESMIMERIDKYVNLSELNFPEEDNV